MNARTPADPGIAIFRLPELVRERWLTNSSGVRAFAFAPNHDALAVLTETNLCLWDTTTWQLKKSRPASADPFSKIEYAPDGRTMLVSENARTSALLDAISLEPLLPLPVWTHPLALSADNRHLAIAVEGRRVQLWDLAAVRAKFRDLGVDWKD